VLVPLLLHPSGVQVIFTRRTESLSSHAGQISFPGGRIDSTDATPAAAAVREMQEELGVVAERVTLVGRLDEMITVTGYHVTPVVGTLPGSTLFQPNPAEVARVLTVPLEHLLQRDRWEHHVRTWQGQSFRMWQIVHEGDVIWGATAMMLRQFVELLWAANI